MLELVMAATDVNVMPFRISLRRFHDVRFDVVGRGVSEHREDRAYRDGDRAHRVDLPHDRHAQRRGGLRGDRSAEPGDDAHRDEESGRTDAEASRPARQPLDVAFDVERIGGTERDDVTDYGRQHEPERVDDRSPHGTEHDAVHDRERVRHRERRGRDDREHDDRQRYRQRADSTEHQLDPGAVRDDEACQRKGAGQDDDGFQAAEQTNRGRTHHPLSLPRRPGRLRTPKSGVDRRGARQYHDPTSRHTNAIETREGDVLSEDPPGYGAPTG